MLPAAGYRRMPWKNGGGETFEIAVSPQGATLATMDWRVSMAIVAGDGPFSSFPGFDRTLSILEGAGMQLELGEDRARFALTPESAPFHFPADVATCAQLLDGTVTDLNVMTRRGRWHHAVSRLQVAGAQTIATRATEAVVFCISGIVTCTAGDAVTLHTRDCALLQSPATGISLVGTADATVLLVEFFDA
jgi:environmental stress-induced protein Ves